MVGGIQVGVDTAEGAAAANDTVDGAMASIVGLDTEDWEQEAEMADEASTHPQDERSQIQYLGIRRIPLDQYLTILDQIMYQYPGDIAHAQAKKQSIQNLQRDHQLSGDTLINDIYVGSILGMLLD